MTDETKEPVSAEPEVCSWSAAPGTSPRPWFARSAPCPKRKKRLVKKERGRAKEDRRKAIRWLAGLHDVIWVKRPGELAKYFEPPPEVASYAGAYWHAPNPHGYKPLREAVMKTFRDHPKRASILDAMDKFAWDYRKIATNRRARMRRKRLLTITSIGLGLAIFALAKELFKS